MSPNCSRSRTLGSVIPSLAQRSGLEFHWSAGDIASVSANAIRRFLVERLEGRIALTPGVGDEPIRPRRGLALTKPLGDAAKLELCQHAHRPPRLIDVVRGEDRVRLTQAAARLIEARERPDAHRLLE